MSGNPGHSIRFSKAQSIKDYSEFVATFLITWNIIDITNRQFETLILRQNRL